MNTPDYLRHIGDNAVELVEEAFHPVIESMAKRIVKLGSITDSTQYQLERLAEAGYLAQDVNASVAALTGSGAESPLQREVEEAMTAAAERSIAFDNRIYAAAGMTTTALNNSPALQRVLESEILRVGEELSNLTRTTAVTTQSAFIQACDLAHLQVQSGVLSYTQAITEAVRKAAGDGIYVRYEKYNPKTRRFSSHRDTIEVAVRRAVLTGSNQATGVMQMELALEMGADIMEITAHWGARPDHQPWQGGLVSLSNAPGYWSLDDIGYGDVRGFKGANCRHDWFPFIEGVSERVYNPQDLLAMERATVVYDGEEMSLYDATQKQRGMERAIRKSKRELLSYDAAAHADGLDIIIASMQNEYNNEALKLKRAREALKDFEEQTGLPSQAERQQIYGFGRSEASRATWGARKAQ